MSRLEEIKDRLDSQDEMMLTHSDLADLVAVIEAVQRVRDIMRQESGNWANPEDRFARLLDEALRPLTE